MRYSRRMPKIFSILSDTTEHAFSPIDWIGKWVGRFQLIGLVVALAISILGAFFVPIGRSEHEYLSESGTLQVHEIETVPEWFVGFVIFLVLVLFLLAISNIRLMKDRRQRSEIQNEPVSEPRFDQDVRITSDTEEPLIFLDPEVPEDSTKRKAVEVVFPVRSERSTDALLCRVRIDSAMSSSGREGRFIDHSLMWTTGRDEEMIPPETTLRFQIARSHIRPFWIRRITELVFGGGGTEILKLLGYRPGGTFWLSIELSFSNSKPVYGVYRLDSDALHIFFDTEDASESDVVQLIGQFDEPPDLEQLIEEYDQRLSETD